MFRPRWWETGFRDEIWMGQDTLIWAAQDLCANRAALTTPDRPFAELLWTAQAEYRAPYRSAALRVIASPRMPRAGSHISDVQTRVGRQSQKDG